MILVCLIAVFANKLGIEMRDWCGVVCCIPASQFRVIGQERSPKPASALTIYCWSITPTDLYPRIFCDHFFIEKLTKPGDPQQKMNVFIDWKIF